MSRIIEWMARYEHELLLLKHAKPDKYIWPESALPEVVSRMRASFLRGAPHYNKDSDAIRATCKFFGIPPTYSAIDKFIKGQ